LGGGWYLVFGCKLLGAFFGLWIEKGTNEEEKYGSEKVRTKKKTESQE
jgi:hypothetical protein